LVCFSSSLDLQHTGTQFRLLFKAALVYWKWWVPLKRWSKSHVFSFIFVFPHVL